MKKILVLICAAVVGLAACSKNKKSDDYSVYSSRQEANANVKNGNKYQILDQEFDNKLAPESDYDLIPAYELQACGDSYLPPVEAETVTAAKKKARTQAKAAETAVSTKTTRAKKVTNTVNIYEVDGPNPNIPVSSTTTTKTVYQNGEVVSSTTESSNTKTTTNPDGSVTTTTVNR